MVDANLMRSTFPRCQFVRALDTVEWRRFRDRVEAIQCPFEIVKLEDWSGNCESTKTISAVFFDRETQAAWASRPSCPVDSAVAIVLHDHQGPPIEVISQFRGVLYWPCDEEELRLGLARIAKLRPSEDEATSSADLELLRSNLIGRSEPFEKVLQQVQQIAGYDVTVLVEGETGTGKELVARALHYLSHRCDGPFVAVNCGSIPEALFENELFGHKKGAYTDARHEQVGLVADAAGGTLFLDEIDTLSLRSQAALLRFLETRKFAPLGSRSAKRVDVRIVAATNQDLASEVERGRFRNDVFFRLDMLALRIPPLRARDGDAILLAEYFMSLYADQYRLSPEPLSDAALAWIANYEWPGNVRELQNRIHKAILLDESIAFDVTGDPSSRVEERFSVAKAQAIAEFERRYLERLLSRTKGNVSRAAEIAGKDRSAFGKLLKKHLIDWRGYRD
jgi:DNA-binding NtrC family response regulator